MLTKGCPETFDFSKRNTSILIQHGTSSSNFPKETVCVRINVDTSEYIMRETYCEDGEPIVMMKIDKCINIMY